MRGFGDAIASQIYSYIDFIHLHIQLLLMEILFLHVMSIVNLERSNLTDKI